MQSLWAVVMVLFLACTRVPAVPRPDGGQRSGRGPDTYDLDQAPDYDPWRPFNETMFNFNHDVLDRWLLKPAATCWGKAIPRLARRGLARALDNLDMPRRLVNNLLQLRPVSAGREVGRFVLNSTVGVAGFVDVASLVHLAGSDADAGQTLALYGVGSGPYLVLPTMPPLTVRDAVGRTADGFLDPVGLFLPFVANRVKAVVTVVNERSLDLQRFADVEDSVLDLYSAARNAYLQRRRATIVRAATDRDAQWQWAFGPAKAEPVVAVAATQSPATQ